MKLTSIHVENVLGIRAAAVALSHPITLFAAPNGNGKTSLAEAIRMSLLGDIEARGVHLKKDLQALVREGAKAGSVEVQHESGLVTFALLPSGKSTPAEAYVPHKALPFVLEPHRFAALADNERRSFLFDLMGLKITPAVVIERLAARGVNAQKAERVGPLLKAGFDAACTEAKRKATEAKGAWRALTGETYGAVKAETWAAPTVAVSPITAKETATELQHCEVALEQWQKQIGGIEKDEQRRTALRAKLPGLVEQVEKLERIQNKLTADEAGLAEWEQRLQATAAKAGHGKREGMVHDLARSVCILLDMVDETAIDFANDPRPALDAYETEFGRIDQPGNPEAQAKLPEVRKSRDLMDNAVQNGRRDLNLAKKALAECESIDKELADLANSDTTGLAEAKAQAETLKAQRAELVKKADTLKAQKAAADAAEKKTADARTHHDDVLAWDLIAAGLAPDGIPGEMLAEALGPFNERLAQSAADSEWTPIRVSSDMAIETAETVDGRPYKLLSESEQWRADTILAEAISHLSGLKLLMLDRFDVLDLKGRADLFAWLEILATEGEIETALLFGTLKGIPAELPPTVAAHWIEGGVVGQLKEAA